MKKTILLTGATGTFGKMFIDLSKYSMGLKIIALGRDEFKIAQLKNKYIDRVKDRSLYSKIEFVIGDIRDKKRMAELAKRADYCVHAAALKRVELGEEHPREFYKTNVLGTKNLSELFGKDMLLISTDKAVDPVNFYGKTKAKAEQIVIGNGGRVLRYGNIIGSRGSIISHWKSIISGGGTISITDLNCTRFFVELETAVNRAVQITINGSPGLHFVNKMKAASVEDILNAFKASKYGEDIKYKYTGLPKYEKLHETMLPDLGLVSNSVNRWTHKQLTDMIEKVS